MQSTEQTTKEPLHRQLARDPLAASLSLKFVIANPDGGESDIQVETSPPSKREKWNIKAMMRVQGVKPVPGTYVFVQHATKGLTTCEVPAGVHDQDRQRLKIAFTSVLMNGVSELVEVFSGFPTKTEIEKTAGKIVTQLHSGDFLSELLGEEPKDPRDIKVIVSDPHRTTAESILKGRSSWFKDVLRSVAAEVQVAAEPGSKILWTPRKGGTEVHVCLRHGGDTFEDYVNGALAFELTEVLKVKERETAKEIFRRMHASVSATQAQTDAFAKKHGFTKDDLEKK